MSNSHCGDRKRERSPSPCPYSSNWYMGGARFKSQPRHQVTWYTFRIMTLNQMKLDWSCSGQRSTNSQRRFRRCGEMHPSSSPMDAFLCPYKRKMLVDSLFHLGFNIFVLPNLQNLLLLLRFQIHLSCWSVLGRSNNFLCL